MASIIEIRKNIDEIEVNDGNILIVNVVNDAGSINTTNEELVFKKYPQAKEAYLNEYKKHFLGDIQLVDCGQNEQGQQVYIVNAFGFRVSWSSENAHPIRYDVLRGAFQKIVDIAKERDCSIHFAKWDSERFGTPWENIETIIRKEYVSQGVKAYVYIGGR